jgi:hypothetical protein
VVESQQVAWIDLADYKGEQRWQDDETSSKTSVGLNCEGADKNDDWEYKDSTPEDRGLITLLICDFYISLNLFAHGLILVLTYTLAP